MKTRNLSMSIGLLSASIFTSMILLLSTVSSKAYANDNALLLAPYNIGSNIYTGTSYIPTPYSTVSASESNNAIQKTLPTNSAESNAVRRLNSLSRYAIFQNGATWNDDYTYSGTGTLSRGAECVAFAYAVQDGLFGRTESINPRNKYTPRRVTTNGKTIGSINGVRTATFVKIGDVVKLLLSTGRHVAVVRGKTSTGINLIDGNVGGRVNWGNGYVITYENFNAQAIEVISRYAR